MYVEANGEELILSTRTTRRLMDEHEAVQRDVERIWTDFLRQEAETRGVRTVRIDVEEKGWRVIGDGVAQASMSFRLRRTPSGHWQKEGGFAFPSASQIPGTWLTATT